MTKKPTGRSLTLVPPVEEDKERIFEDGPWAQKFMHGADKKTAFYAAKRSDKTMTVWLGEAIRARVASEREPREADTAEASTIGQAEIDSLRLLGPLNMTADEVFRTIEVAEEIAKRRGLTVKPNSKLLIDAQRVLGSNLGRAAHRPSRKMISGS